MMKKLAPLTEKTTILALIAGIILGGLFFSVRDYYKKKEVEVKIVEVVDQKSQERIKELETQLIQERKKLEEETRKRKYTKIETKPDGTKIEKVFEREETKKKDETDKNVSTDKSKESEKKEEVKTETEIKAKETEEEKRTSSKIVWFLIGVISTILIGVPL